MNEHWSFWLPGISHRVKKEQKPYISVPMTDGGEKIPFFTNYGPFFTASNAQKIKVKSIFHKWEDQMI